MVLLLGECRVEYQGRAKSRLGWGERLVIVKRDGSVLVHQGTSREPVNWQPPGTRPMYFASDDVFTIKAERPRAHEHLKVEFRRIDLLVMKVLDDRAELQLAGLEEDLVEKIMADPSIVEDGLRITGREKGTVSGSIDLFARDREGNHVIVEVKRGSPGVSAAYQLEAYAADFRRRNPDCPIRGILVAPRIPLMVKNTLREKGLEYREVDMRFELEEDSQSKLAEWLTV